MENVEKDAITMVAAIVCAAMLVGTALVLNGVLLLGRPLTMPGTPSQPAQ